MNFRPLALLILIPVLGSGCSFVANIRRNVVVMPFNGCTDKADLLRSHNLAREAFRQMALQFPDQEFSCDYRGGFVDGFADFIEYGGVGEPPPFPPVRYRGFGYMTPEGLAAMEDWKVGFRHGAATAKASNLRELTTLPLYWGPTFSSAGPTKSWKQLEAESQKTETPESKETTGPKPPPPADLPP